MFAPAGTALRKEVRSEKGVALVAALLAVSMLTLIGLSMTFVSSTEVLVNQNNRMRLVNFYLAESASEEARERIKGFLTANQLSISDSDKVVYIVADPSIDPTAGDAISNPYFDTAYSPSLSTTILPSELTALGFAWVRVWQKTEQRAGYSLTNSGSPTTGLVLYGLHRFQPDSQLTQYLNAGSNVANYAGSPVYLVTALAKNDGGYQQLVGTDIASVPSPPLNAAVFSRDTIQVLGPDVIVSGDDLVTGNPLPLNGLESNATIGGNITNVTGTPQPAQPMSPYTYNMSSLLKALKPPFSKEIEQVAPGVSRLEDGTYVGSGLSLGQIPTGGDLSQATYVNGPLNLSDSSGQGILIVNGDLSITGTFTYFGLILVKGKVHLNGGGTDGIRLYGAIVSSSNSGSETSVLEGIVRIYNDSAVILNQFGRQQYARLAFRQM